MDPRLLSVRYEVVLEYKGEPLVDSKLANLLRFIRDTGSLLAAATMLGIPYSRAWEALTRAERVLGERLVTSFRGGSRRGGTQLTEAALELLRVYEEAEAKLRRAVPVHALSRSQAPGEPELVVAHSHDPLLELVLERLRGQGTRLEHLCIGSGMALAALSLEEVDVACTHLYDPEKREFNAPYLDRYWLSDRVRVIGGYYRELVFAYRPDRRFGSVTEVLDLLLRGKVKLVNRNRGSGTRVLLDHLLRGAAGSAADLRKVRGYGIEVRTHDDAAKYVAVGRADVALVLRHVAEKYGLKTLHVVWEKYECFALRSRLGKKGVRAFGGLLNSEWFKELLKNARGYALRPAGSA